MTDDLTRKKPVFDPTINLGHVLTATCMLAAGFASYSALDRRVVVVEEKVANAVQQSTEQRAEQRDAAREIKSDIKDMQHTLNEITRTLTQRK